MFRKSREIRKLRAENDRLKADIEFWRSNHQKALEASKELFARWRHLWA